MAFVKTEESGPPRNARGQGVIEAIVALPVFLVLVCLIFQLFFLAIARVQLQYAAFYAARSGVVHDGDIRVMEKTASRILAASPGLSPFRPGSLLIELIDGNDQETDRQRPQGGPAPNTHLGIRVTWNYPLIVPLASRLFGRSSGTGPYRSGPTIPLHASWTMEMQQYKETENSDER
ncbi:MAG: pilus assembly protein [bacterium]|nr:pilus assembly protein [bacterium]MDT8395526.1 pilus assembly protein [bacterium]